MTVEKIIGKPADMFTVKKKLVENFVAESRMQQRKRQNQAKLADVTNTECPICGSRRVSSSLCSVSGIVYLECEHCCHMFTQKKLSKKNLERLYAETAFNQAEYLDGDAAVARLEEIYLPKAEFVINHFNRIKKRNPLTLLDIGSGTGGFVAACRLNGISADGIEPDVNLRQAARNHYGVELKKTCVDDMVADAGNLYDIVSLWGVLEHVDDPVSFLEKSSKLMHPHGWIVFEVPRGRCISSLIQSCFPERIVRHLDPVSHIHLFSEQSIGVMLEKNVLKHEVEWVFGMDAYELVLQLCTHFHVPIDTLDHKELSWFIDTFQQVVDHNSLSDAIVCCASRFE